MNRYIFFFVLIVFSVSCKNDPKTTKSVEVLDYELDAKEFCACLDEHIAIISEMEAIPPIGNEGKAKKIIERFEERMQEAEGCAQSVLDKYDVENVEEGASEKLEKAIRKHCAKQLEIMDAENN